MPPTRILVVDDDAWILRMVTTVLEKRGYDIQVAKDGEEGLERAQRERPDLIITDVMMPKLDGWALVKKLRSTPELAFVPVIFLTALGSEEDRIRGFRLGADDYLAKPFRFEELDLRVAKALRQRGVSESPTRDQVRRSQPRATVASTSTDGAGIRGTLDQLGLSSLLIVLEMERKSGLLVLTSPEKTEVGRIFLRNGRVVRARLEAQKTLKNDHVIYHLLTWSRGSFEFHALEVDMEDEVRMTTTGLLMEGARRMDEAKRPDL